MARPHGLRLNSDAVEDRLEALNKTRTEIAEQAEMSLGSLMDLMKGRRGASIAVANALSAALEVRPGTIFPELSKSSEHRFSWSPAVEKVSA